MKTIIFILVALLVFSCSSNDEDENTNPENNRESFAEFISPADTDSKIKTLNNNFHYAIFNESDNKQRNELLVFLGGTFSKTSGTSIFSEFAAEKSFHVINLAYPNSVPAQNCSDKADENCA